MAIALDSSTNGGSTTATSLTFSHTTAGSNRILHVSVVTDTADNSDYVTGVTYNAVAMTRVDAFHSPGLGGHTMYELVNPATGANNVVVSLSASKAVYAVALSHTGVKQTGQPDASTGNAVDPATTLTQNVTTVADNCWLVSAAGRRASTTSTISAGANTTARQVNNFVAIGDSNSAKTPPGSFGQTWTQDTNTGLSVIVVSISPVPDATNNDDFAYFI